MITQQQKDLLFGTLLGDGSLQTENGNTWRYRALHKKDHKDYLFHKYEILKPLCGSEPHYSETTDSRTKKTYGRFAFNTLVSSELLFYANMFYTRNPKNPKQWIKDVPNKVEKHLTPAAVAYFYMDDGSLKSYEKSNAMRLCTESFSVEGVHRLQNALQNCYNLRTTTTKRTLSSGEIRLRMAIPEKSSAAFREIIKPYLIDCMKYKVSDGNKRHL